MTRGRAKLAMSQGLSVWVLEAPAGFGDAAVHAHHAIQLTACLSGDLALSNEQETLAAHAVAVAADARHRFAAHGLLVFLFVEPESRLGRALTAALFGASDLARVEPAAFLAHLAPLKRTFADGFDQHALLAAGRAAVESIAPLAQARLPDPRIQQIIAYAAAHLDSPLTLASASSGIFLSPSRLRHLFVEQTGLAFRTYVQWLRLGRAVALYADGASLTEAAHAAGFSDSAHFSRIFKRTFGLPATTLTRL